MQGLPHPNNTQFNNLTMTQPNGLIDIPDEWTQTVSPEDTDGYILEAYQRGDGLVIAVEEGTVSEGRYAVTALPENWRDDNQPIRRYGDDGYFWTGDDINTAKTELQRILENPDGYE